MEEQLNDRIISLENQVYILYLQINALVNALETSGQINKEQLLKDMDELNQQVYQAAQEVGQKVEENEERE